MIYTQTHYKKKESFQNFIHKSLPKNLKFKKHLKLWGFWQNYKILQYTTWGQKIFFDFQIFNLTPFCNLKRYFCVFDHFIHKSLPKNLKFKKYSILSGPWQNYNLNYIILSTKCLWFFVTISTSKNIHIHKIHKITIFNYFYKCVRLILY